MQIKSWHLALTGFSIYMSSCLFYLVKNSLQDCALVGDCIGCGSVSAADCAVGVIGSDLDYLFFMTLIVLVPFLLLRMEKTKKIGAVLNVLLGLLFIYAVSATDNELFYAFISMLLPAFFFLSAGARFFLRENIPGRQRGDNLR